MKSETPSPLGALTPAMLVLDVDGVLTDNSLWLSETGDESKCFHVPDGAGIRWLIESGIEVAWISGRVSLATKRRAKQLGVKEVHMGIGDKATCLLQLLERSGISACDTVYVGDDLIDLPPMALVGVGVAVADAHREVRESADLVTTARGGRGAVREVCEWILMAHGVWSERVGREMTGDTP